jgi:glycosyltransferase involved in cell wall biosynthesis
VTAALSIIVPGHHNARVIRDTLMSIERSLSYLRDRDSRYNKSSCDVVVVDDGSTDDSHRIVSEFALDQPRYTIIRGDSATNAGCARNRGAAAAQREILFFLDADDRFLEPHIHVCCQALEDPAVQFVKTGVARDDPVHPEWEGRIANSLVIKKHNRRGANFRSGLLI